MRLRFFDRHDAFLIAGFTIALIVVFAKPLRYVLDLAREVEDTYGLALVPALIILTVVFLFQQQSKRQEVHAQVLTAGAEARQALDRARELELLVVFGQSLARALDMEALREAVLRHLPQLVGSADAWVLIRTNTGWEGLMGATRSGKPDMSLEGLADLVLSQAGASQPAGIGIEREGHLCLPMIVGGTVVGVLGVARGSELLTESRRRVLAASSALLAIAVKNVQLFDEIRLNSLHDGLTRCFNRTHGLDVLENELHRARRSNTTVTIILFDIDHFKAVNDRYGHLCGDAVLVAVGRRIREALRSSDIKCRYGGEEFLVILPDTSIGGAKRVAETLRLEVSEVQVQWHTDAIRVTASFGVAAASQGEIDVPALIARADAALYVAKKLGRNRVCVSEESPTSDHRREGGSPAREPLVFPSPGHPRATEAG
jgi:diguanylate cyclase (GGDEF)-like protein